jgi:hypothetical protein
MIGWLTPKVLAKLSPGLPVRLPWASGTSSIETLKVGPSIRRDSRQMTP